MNDIVKFLKNAARRKWNAARRKSESLKNAARRKWNAAMSYSERYYKIFEKCGYEEVECGYEE